MDESRMMTKGDAVAIVVSMAMVWGANVDCSVSAWSLSPLTVTTRTRMGGSGTTGQTWHHRNSETILHAAPDAPLFSDDLTGRTNHGPNPRNLTVKYKETMLRQAYDEWRAKYGRGEFDNERFRIFKFNFLASLRAHELQAYRAKIEGRPLPKLLELNAYGDCTKEEYLQLKQQESQNLVASRTILDANATSTSTANTTSTPDSNVTAATATATTPTSTDTVTSDAQPKTPDLAPKKPYSLPVDNRGPERERKAATSFPQRSTNLTAALTPLSPMTPKVPPSKRLQQQLDDLAKATNSLAPQPTSSSKKPPQFTSVGASQLPKPSPSFLKPDEKGIFPERSASYFPKRTIPPKLLGASKSDQESKQVNVNPNPDSSYIPPDQRGIFGDKSATTFPKRTEAHATPKTAQKTDGNIGQSASTSTSASVNDTPPAEQGTKVQTTNDSSNSPPAQEVSTAASSTLPQATSSPAEALSDQDKRDVTNVQPDAATATSTSIKESKPPIEEITKATPTTTNSATTPVLMPDTKDVPKIRADSYNVKPDIKRSFAQNLASSFSKQDQVNQKTGTSNASDAPPRPSTSVKPDVFYKEQSALSFPKRTQAHQAPRKVVSDSTTSEISSASEPVASPKVETDGTSVTSETGPRPSTNPSGSFVKPDIFFQERSAMTFPKRTEVHKGRLPSSEAEKKQTPSLSYIKPDFRYPERSVTSFPPRPEAQFALVKAAWFCDDTPSQTQPKTLLPDQRRANIADPFSFAKKKRDDLPPPDFEGQNETNPNLENSTSTTSAATSLPVANTVEPAHVELNLLASEPKQESSENSVLVPISEANIAEPKTKREKPEVQVSVPDMTDIQLKLAKLQTKESKPVPKPPTPTSEISARAKQEQLATQPPSPHIEETKVQLLEKESLQQPDQTEPHKDVAEDSKNMAKGKVDDKSPLKGKVSEDKEKDLLDRSHLKERMNLEQKSRKSQENSIGVELNASTVSESNPEATNNNTKDEQSFATGVDKKVNDSTTSMSTPVQQTSNLTTKKVVANDDASVVVAKEKKDKSLKANMIPAVSDTLPAPAEPIQLADKSSSKSMKSESVPDIDPLARQKEIEEALKAEFSAAASTTDRQQQIEAIFEGKVQVQSKRPSTPFYDPFSVSGSSGIKKPKSPPSSVEDVLAAEMNAVKALKTNLGKDPAIKAAEEVLKGPKTVSIHDILKAEMDAAKMMKKTSTGSEADTALSAPLSNGSLKKGAPASEQKEELQDTKSKGKMENKIQTGNDNETGNPTSEEKPQNKKRKRKKKNKNKSDAVDAAVNGLSNTQINGQEKEP